MKLLVTVRQMPRRFVAIGILGLMALSIIAPSTAFAATTATQKCAPADTQCFIAAGDHYIAQRQAALTTLSGKITARRNENLITSDQAKALRADVGTNQSGLASLKSKLDAEKNAQAVRQDVQNIFLQFRIFAVVLPRDYRRLYLDMAVNVDIKLRNLAPKVQQAINNAPPGEKAQLKTLFNDYKNQLTTAESQFDSAQGDFPALTPANYNYNRTTYTATLAKLDTALHIIHTALHQARNDIHQIAKILKGNK